MKKLIILLFIVVTIANQGCKKEKECAGCFTPPENFTFELVDKTTGENMFTNGTFNKRDIEIINLADSSTVEYNFIDEDDVNVIKITKIGWKTEKIHFSFTVSKEYIFSLYVDAERVIDDDCCSYTKYNEVKIEDAESLFQSEIATYKIFVDQ